RKRLGDDEVVIEPSESLDRRQPRELWIVEVASGEARQIPSDVRHVLGVQWSPAQRLLIVAADAPYLDAEQIRPRLMTLPPTGGKAQLYCQTMGKLQNVTWAPDGEAVAFLGSLENGTVFFPNGLFLCRGAGKPPEEIPSGSEYAVESFRWMADGPSLLV